MKVHRTLLAIALIGASGLLIALGVTIYTCSTRTEKNEAIIKRQKNEISFLKKANNISMHELEYKFKQGKGLIVSERGVERPHVSIDMFAQKIDFEKLSILKSLYIYEGSLGGNGKRVGVKDFLYFGMR